MKQPARLAARTLAMTICLGLFATLALAQAAGQPSARRGMSTLQLMNMRVPEIRFENVPLEQVMDWLTEYSGINVTVHWETLVNSGVEKDKPISIKAKNLRLSQVLWLVLNEAGGADVKLAYRASGNLLVLSTHEELGKDMITKVYDVSDLLVRVPRFTNAANLNPAQALNQAGSGGGSGGGGGNNLFQENQGQGGGQGGLGGIGGEGGGVGGTEDMRVLIDLITQTVEPDSWTANGGLGNITPIRGQIVVRNNILVHQRLGGYLEELAGP